MNLESLERIGYGLYVVSAGNDGRANGQIANVVFQLTAEPPTVAISINKENLTHELIDDSRAFAVSILSKETPVEFIRNLGFRSGRDVDKLESVTWKRGSTGTPIVTENATAYFEARVTDKVDCGTHTLFIGEVVDSDTVNDLEPMSYAYYRSVKGGKTAKSAPTYVKESKDESRTSKGGGTMAKYKCTVCGYIYDPGKGDPDHGVPAGTSFQDLSSDWICPVCGASKDEFEEIKE